MKDRKTHRAVKNILHNELGITTEKVQELLVEFINKKTDEKFEQYKNSLAFEYLIRKRIDSELSDKIRSEVKSALAFGVKVNVDLGKPKDESIENEWSLLETETYHYRTNRAGDTHYIEVTHWYNKKTLERKETKREFIKEFGGNKLPDWCLKSIYKPQLNQQ